MSNSAMPDYFELIRQMTGTGGHAMPASNLLFDPAEIEKKIRELQTVHMWLEAQANAVAISIKALEYQRDALAAMQSTSPKSDRTDQSAAASALFDPAAWMAQAMAGLNAMSPAAPTEKPISSSPPHRKTTVTAKSRKRQSKK